jgi:hypothetical protein
MKSFLLFLVLIGVALTAVGCSGDEPSPTVPSAWKKRAPHKDD